MNNASEQAELLQLVLAVQQGSQDAFGKLYEMTVNKVYSIVYRIIACQDDSEDVVSEVYAQLWQQIDTYSTEKGSVMGWCLLIARSRALDLYRKRKNFSKAKESVVSINMGDELSSEELSTYVSYLEDSEKLSGAMSLLSEQQRQALALAFFRGYTHSELSEVLGQPLGSVKSSIRRSLIILRGHIEEVEGYVKRSIQ